MSVKVEIVGTPIACCGESKDSWRQVATWIAREVERGFGSAVRVGYFDLFDPECPRLPEGASLPVILVEGDPVSIGKKISLPLIRKSLQDRGVEPLRCERGEPMAETKRQDEIVTQVRERYSRIAELGDCGCCGGTTAEGSAPADIAKRIGYDEGALNVVPDGANLGLGCGAPVGFLQLKAGETVVDLGSGAGFDAFLAAQEVGPTGKVIGVDMTPAMLERARANAAKAGLSWVEFREGRLEALPVDTASVDAVTSNCVINLAPDKPVVFREAARVLRRGGRMVVSDIILDGDLPEVVKEDVEAYVGCIAGAMRREPYFAAIEAAGFDVVELIKDVDYLAVLGEDALPNDLLEKMRASDLRLRDLAGTIRSVTYRAVRR